jgi:tetratricopeptide (TPR) repeat protein
MNRNERRRLAKTNKNVPRGVAGEALRLGFKRHQEGDLAGAEALFRRILGAEPEHPEAMRMLAEVLIDAGKSGEAIALLGRFVSLYPRHFSSHYSLGNALRLGGRLDDAMAAYRASLALNPGFAGAHHGLGAALRAAEREREAAECFRQAVQAKPDWAVAWQDYGMMLAILGALPEAEKALEKAIALDPRLADARRHLAAIQRDKADPSQTGALLAMAANPQTKVLDRIEVLFTLGRLADQADQFDAAFGYFAQANALLRAVQAKSRLGYDRAKMTRDVDRLISVFTPELFAGRRDWGNPSEVPVFIVGMPRAGSTLFEQIAASHSQVFGAGERKGIGEISRALGWGPSPLWTEPNIQAAALRYLRALQGIGGAALRVIDKLPDNIFQLGLIATLFPGARVVFCEREPLDVCLSCFFQRFAEPNGFDTDLEDCAHRWLETERLTRHWRQVLPLRMTAMSYDALLGDPEGESRRLIGFLGLEWEAGCLNFHQTDRPVRTASWSQVRQPLYQRSAGRWVHYGNHLGKLIKALGR